MTQRALWGLGAVGLVLAGTIALELTGIVADDGGMNPSPLRAAPARPAAVPAALAAPSADGRQAWVATMLARPLFAVGRRPTPGPAGIAAAPAALPRLAGVLVNGVDRNAIFAATDGRRPVVAAIGAQVGDWTVQSIEAGQVTLSGPGGTQVLRPSFDPRRDSGPAVGANGIDPGSAPAAPFAAATEIMPSLRGLPGFSGAPAR